MSLTSMPRVQDMNTKSSSVPIPEPNRRPASGRIYSTAIAIAPFSLFIVLYLLLAYSFHGGGGGGGDARSSTLRRGAHFLGVVSAAPSVTWISIPDPLNFSSALFASWIAPGGAACHDARTAAISISTLDAASADHSPIDLAAGAIHEFTISALDGSGRPRCSGGDYFETDLSGDSWKSRPPVADLGDGRYSLKLQVDPAFAGAYDLTIVLLFRSFEGLKFSPERFAFRRELRKIRLNFHRNEAAPPLPELKLCSKSDFSRQIWSGRWTRFQRNKSCEIDRRGRFRCLKPDSPCRKPWCSGPLGALESNGWVYSAHCSFQIFTQESAWKCLNNKWLFFWGDSNHVDTIRNLLNFVLGLPEITKIPRRIDRKFTNPKNGSESVRITSIFNGHWNDSMNYLGLASLKNEGFKRYIRQYFGEDRVPDVVVLNSGLHDGVYSKSIRSFSKDAASAAEFWDEVMGNVKSRVGAMPKVFYRTTIAVGGYARSLAFNPSKMEVFNGVVVEKLREKGLLSGGVIDEFDMTYPWHYDNRCNDGVHYGRAPAHAKWRDGKIGHQYFVDLMLVHVLLNAFCSG